MAAHALPAAQAESAAVPPSRSTGRIKLAIAAFCVSVGATFGFIAAGVDATAAVGISISCTLAAERIVGMATSRRPSAQDRPDDINDEETEAS
jgi:hypothetical protein